MPDSSTWVCPVEANPLVALDMKEARSDMSEVVCECPSNETALPLTVNALASMESKSSWSNVVAA